jgi:ribosomal protein S18 acetylase RimI-like enzyme
MKCERCEADAVYKCSVCGKMLCGEHAKLRTVCSLCVTDGKMNAKICKLRTDVERNAIKEFVQQFWGEQEQVTFDRKRTIAELPAFVAKVRNEVIGFAAFTETDNSIIIAALGILPKYHGSGLGRKLVTKVEETAKKMGKMKLLVSTSNDDLPALAFYQTIGFQIVEVEPNVIAEKHGQVLKGIGGLPIRDELRLQKLLD